MQPVQAQSVSVFMASSCAPPGSALRNGQRPILARGECAAPVNLRPADHQAVTRAASFIVAAITP